VDSLHLGVIAVTEELPGFGETSPNLLVEVRQADQFVT
jgi:hypothetical protein